MKVKLKSFGLILKNFENISSGIVPKPPKPGFVSFGAIDAEAIWVFGYTRRRLQIMQPGRHLVRAEHYRDLRKSAFGEWGRAVA